MKTIDKVRVFWFDSALGEYIVKKNVEDNEETYEKFKEYIKDKGFQIDLDTDQIIAYEDDLMGTMFEGWGEEYLQRIVYWQESNWIELEIFGNTVQVYWDDIFEALCEHENRIDTYFKPEEVEKLVNGEISYTEFTDKVVNQFAVDYIKVYGLQKIIDDINKLDAYNLKWR